jgi:bifunctional non-homologous end joining protein LigD
MKAKPGKHPSEIEAMQCKLVTALPAGEEWQYELKWDGYRALGSKSAEGTALFSRQQKSFAGTFRTIYEALAELRCKSAIVDGEIVAMVDGRPSFQALQRSKSAGPELFFFLFDVL